MSPDRQELVHHTLQGAAKAWDMAQHYGTYHLAQAIATAMETLKPDEMPQWLNAEQYWKGCGHAIVRAQERLQNPDIYSKVSTTQSEDTKLLETVKHIFNNHPQGAEIKNYISNGGHDEINDRQLLASRGSVFMLNQTHIDSLVKKQQWNEWSHEYHGVSKPPEEIIRGGTVHVHHASMAWSNYMDALTDHHSNPKGKMYGHISHLLTDSAHEMAELISIWEDSITLANPELLQDSDFIECALRYNAKVYAYLPPELQQKEAVVDIMRDVAFCKGGWLSPQNYEGASSNRMDFIQGVPGAAVMCPDNLMYSVKGYEHVSEYLLENQQGRGIYPSENNRIEPRGAAFQFLATARHKFPELAPEFDAAEKRALEKVQQRGRVPSKEKPFFNCQVFPEKTTEKILFNVGRDAITARRFNQYPAQFVQEMAALAKAMPLVELEKHFDVQRAWEGIGRAAQDIEIQAFKEYSHMDTIRGVPREHRAFKEAIARLENEQLPAYVQEMMKKGQDPKRQETLHTLAQEKEKAELQNKIDAMQNMISKAKTNDTFLKYNALELKQWMKDFDLPFLEQHLPLKEFWQSVGATVAQWEKELLNRGETGRYATDSSYSQALREDIDNFTKHMNGKHYEFIRKNISIGRFDAHARDPEVVLDKNGQPQKAQTQKELTSTKEAKSKYGFYYGDAAKTPNNTRTDKTVHRGRRDTRNDRDDRSQ